jgi:hypothetical protein
MASVVAICNSALIKLGEEPIMSLDDGTKPANLCKNRYAMCRDAVYARYPWKILHKRVVLSPDVTAPSFQFKHQFSIPTDCIRVVMVLDASQSPHENYVREGTKLMCNDSVVYLIYTHRLEDVTFIPDYLAELISLNLAMDIAYALTQNASARDMVVALFQSDLRLAKTADSQQDPIKSLIADEWVNSRFEPTY